MWLMSPNFTESPFRWPYNTQNARYHPITIYLQGKRRNLNVFEVPVLKGNAPEPRYGHAAAYVTMKGIYM